MRNILTKTVAVMALSVMTLTAWSSTVDDLVAINHDWAFIADDVTSSGTIGLTVNELYADGQILSAGWAGNSVATNKGSISFASGGTHLNSLRLKNAQNTLAFKVASPCTIIFYTYSDTSRGIRIHKVKRADDNDASYYLQQPVSTPIWEASLDEAGVYYLSSYNGDFYFAGFEVILQKDPAREYTFGYSAALDGTTLSSTLTKHADGCATITTGDFVSTYDKLGGGNRDVYHGSETAYQIDLPFRNLATGTTIKTQNGNEDGAENHGAYLGYSLTIDEGSKISLTEIYTDIYVADKGNWSYEYVIEDGDGNQLYKSPVQTIAAAKSGSGHANSIHLFADAVQDLTGTVNVKLVWWIASSSTYLAIKDFKVKAIKQEVESQTKTLNRIDVNGVEYDFENEGNTISTLLHAAPSVKFYYSVINNWSDGSQTAAPDEEETVIASASGDNYVATTTLASTPYNLTFTNIDLPKVFGITRAVATELSNSTDMESDGVTPKTQNKYAVSADALVDPSVTHVTIAQNYGGRNALTHQSRSFVWNNGSEVQDCFVDYGELSDRTSSGDFNENQYFGFDLTVDLGYKVSLTELVSDALIEKDKTGMHYLVKIYNNDALVAEMPDVEVTSRGVDMKRVIDLSENAALQNLTGKVTVKMFIYGNQGKYIIVKDLSVAAAVETNPGEGINTLSFVEFTPAAHPVFTNGEVSATFSNSANNVGPDGNGRGIRMQGVYNYSMKLEVPEDSYISEVVFVWNNNGNPGVNGNCMNLTVTNDVNQVVGTLTDKKVSNEKAWACGDVRESELTFAQGDGDFYLNSIRVTYLKKDDDPDKQYTRTHAHMYLNTLCFPYTVTAYTGGTFYTMLYKRMEGSVPVEVVLEEHEGNLVAGTPYFYMPEGSQLELTYSGTRENTPSKVNGMQGIYDEQVVAGSDLYVTYQGTLRAVGSNVTLKEYRAYVDMNAVSEQVVAPASGKKLLRIRNADAPQSPTAIDQISQEPITNSQKLLINGQLRIIRDGKVYNAQGQIVK